MTLRSTSDLDSPDSSSTLSTSSTSTDEHTPERLRSGPELFHRYINAYTTALNAIEHELQAINREKVDLAPLTTISTLETADLLGPRVGGAINLDTEHWAKKDRICERERKLQNQLVVLTRWVKKLKSDIEEFVKENEDAAEDEGGSRDKDTSDAA